MNKKNSILMSIFMIIMVLFVFGPFIMIIPASFAKSNMFSFPPIGFTLDHYNDLVSDSQLWSSVSYSLYIGIISTLIASLIGTMSAVGIIKGNIPFKDAVKSFFMGPLIIPLVTSGISFLIFFITLDMKNSPFTLIIAHSVIICPYITRIACSNLKQTNQMLEEAAIVHGASIPYMFRTVLLPNITPSIIAGAIMSFLVSMDEYTVTVFLTQSTKATVPIRIFQYVTMDINPIVAAFSSLIIIISFVVIIILEKKFNIHKYINV